jgi:hypothetical protein
MVYEQEQPSRDGRLRVYPRGKPGALSLRAVVLREQTGLYGCLTDGRTEYDPLEIGQGDEATLASLVEAMLNGRIEGTFSTFCSWGWGRSLRWNGDYWGVMHPFPVFLLPAQRKRYEPYEAPF